MARITDIQLTHGVREMDVVDAIYGRRAIRDFTDAAIPHEEIEALIEAAIEAPSGVNLQPWTFVVASGRPLLARWSKLAKAHVLDTQTSTPHGLMEHLTSEAFNIFYNAPHLIVICATDTSLMSLKDCCLAAENLMLAAYDRGMGSCWIWFSESWLASPQGREELGIRPDCVPVAPVILGRPTGSPPRPHRNPPAIRWIAPQPVMA